MLIEAILLAGGVILMILSTTLILITGKREKVREFWGLFISFVLLSFHISVEFALNILLPAEKSYEPFANKLISLSLPALLFGIWGIMISIFLITGKNWTILDLFHSLSVGIAIAIISLTVKISVVGDGWYTQLLDPWYILIVGPPFLLLLFRILWTASPLLKRQLKGNNSFFSGWVILAFAFLLLSIERLLGMDTAVFRILYPFGIFMLSYSIYKNPLIFFVRQLNPKYFFITRKVDNTVLFSHSFVNFNLSFLPTAVEAAMEILAETAGTTTPPRSVRFFDAMIAIAETDNLYGYLFSDYSNFSVERKMIEILTDVENKMKEGFDKSHEAELKENLEFFRK